MKGIVSMSKTLFALVKDTMSNRTWVAPIEINATKAEIAGEFCKVVCIGDHDTIIAKQSKLQEVL